MSFENSQVVNFLEDATSEDGSDSPVDINMNQEETKLDERVKSNSQTTKTKKLATIDFINKKHPATQGFGFTNFDEEYLTQQKQLLVNDRKKLPILNPKGSVLSCVRLLFFFADVVQGYFLFCDCNILAQKIFGLFFFYCQF